MSIDPRTPVLVGAGVASQRFEDPREALEQGLALTRSARTIDAEGMLDAFTARPPAGISAGTATVASPSMASSATFALKAAE